MYRSKNKYLAFTLVELMVVVAVIGVLASIGIVSYTRVQVNARDYRRSTAVSLIQESLDKYYTNNGEYPSCTLMSQSIETVSKDILPGIDPAVLTAPTAVTGTNSINCSSSDPTGDTYNYVGGKSYIIRYIDEANDEIISSKGRYGYNISKLDLSYQSSCGTTDDDYLYCWGWGEYTQLGNSNPGDAYANEPIPLDTSGVLANKKIKSFTLGNSHGCALDTNNTAYCWGWGGDGELGSNTSNVEFSPVAVYTEGELKDKYIKSIDAGDWHTCAIASDDNAYCWGYGYDGALGTDSWDNEYTPAAVDRSGALAGLTIKQISAGKYHTCAIASDNNGYCWGYGGDGRLGTGSTGETNTPLAVIRTGVLAGRTLKQISAGGNHTCAIADNDEAYCWGNNNYGELGNNSTSDSSVPVKVSASGVLNSKIITSIKTDELYTCALTSEGKVACWGWGYYGQIGIDNGTFADDKALVPVLIQNTGLIGTKTVLDLSVTDSVTCGIASDSYAYCWGAGVEGQLGLDDWGWDGLPYKVDNSNHLLGKSIVSVEGGDDFTCALTHESKIYCWGKNLDGSHGSGLTTNRLEPTLVQPDLIKKVKGFALNESHACAIGGDGLAYCWGKNPNGQIGVNGADSYEFRPLAVDTSGLLSGKTIKSIAVGKRTSYVIASDDLVYSWGLGNSGESGTNTLATGSTPKALYMDGYLSGLTIKAISAGYRSACVIASDDNAYCWGANDGGVVGDGTSSQRLAPVPVDTTGELNGLTIKKISTEGGLKTCVIASDDNAYCWGENYSGQLGNGNQTQSYFPVAVKPDGELSGLTVKEISAGNEHACVIASNEKVYCWGNNDYGQLGDGTYTSRSVPTLVVNQGSNQFKEIAAGGEFTCAINTNDETFCWGRNEEGQFGNGEMMTESNVPVNVFF